MRQKNKREAEDVTFELGSDNVFADLGLENADELLANADLTHAINTEIRAHGWTQVEAAERTGVTQSDISRLGKMKTDGFSQERMQNALRRLGMDVEIKINRRADGGPGMLKVSQPK
ncbi:MAG TPA: helix-turn-helix transcriptional regulator [Burkholderiales bacterium]|nr:helix-turn-helix transcriptional regulator [Burkholderiales bacterium]